MICDRKNCTDIAEFIIGTAHFYVCKTHTEEWIAMFKNEKSKKIALRSVLSLFPEDRRRERAS